MKHIPILFSTDMVQAIIDGRKTQTRRVIKSPFQEWITDENINSEWAKDIDQHCPYGQPGDVLWVREVFGYTNACELRYKANAEQPKYDKPHTGWKPGIHMPKTACRIFLQITDIRVERLQEISEDDAKAEGVEMGFCHDTVLNKDLVTYKNYLTGKHIWMGAKLSFRTLWESINGEQSWQSNHWVWVISFKQINKPENFC